MLHDYKDEYRERDKRIKEYNKNGWENAKKDVDPVIRMNYYKRFGYDKEALKDDFHAIRFDAYNHLGWSKQASKDSCRYIQDVAWSKGLF
jgi:hypothetical protein